MGSRLLLQRLLSVPLRHAHGAPWISPSQPSVAPRWQGLGGCHSALWRGFAAAARDPYTVLGVSPRASEDEVKKAYRQAALKWHPDRHADAPAKMEAERRFKEISEAYQAITDGTARGYGGSQGAGAQQQHYRQAYRGRPGANYTYRQGDFNIHDANRIFEEVFGRGRFDLEALMRELQRGAAHNRGRPFGGQTRSGRRATNSGGARGQASVNVTTEDLYYDRAGRPIIRTTIEQRTMDGRVISRTVRERPATSREFRGASAPTSGSGGLGNALQGFLASPLGRAMADAVAYVGVRIISQVLLPMMIKAAKALFRAIIRGRIK